MSSIDTEQINYMCDLNAQGLGQPIKRLIIKVDLLEVFVVNHIHVRCMSYRIVTHFGHV